LRGELPEGLSELGRLSTISFTSSPLRKFFFYNQSCNEFSLIHKSIFTLICKITFMQKHFFWEIKKGR
jgi:hypothetical protein